MTVADRINAALSDRYRIVRPLGEGGMATVYLAEDLKHDRLVALKVLKPELSAVLGAERFLAEIKTTANLQHPHILPLFDSGEADGLLFYVMPYVEGESLRDRLDREKQLPVAEATAILKDVCEALNAAHEAGVIHRDIKPANILLRNGKPLVADFGIALAVSSAGGGRLTETGLSLGTPYYMSPEQASADRVPTPATDVYSLGCVAYEMLVGEPPFVGSSAQAVLAKILTTDATRTRDVRKAIPANVDAAIARAIEKLPADRFATIRDLERALEDPGFRWGEASAVAGVDAPGPWKPIGLAAAAVAILAVAFGLTGRGAPPREPEWRRVQLVPEEVFGSFQTFATMDVSPDGTRIVHASGRNGGLLLYTSGRLDPELLDGTAGHGPISPRFSPDGEWIAYLSDADRSLKRIPAAGGVAQTLADSVRINTPEPAWLDDETILFTAPGNRLGRISANGGAWEVALDGLDAGLTISGVEALPDGRGALLLACGRGLCADAQIWSWDARTGEAALLQDGAIRAWYLPATKRIVFGSADGTLTAAGFDLRSLSLEGPVVRVLDGIESVGPALGAIVGSDGTLVYVEGTASGEDGGFMTPAWVQRDGTATPVDPDWRGNFGSPALSPDGRYLAITSGTNPSAVVVRELPRGPITRLTTDGIASARPAWTPDGRSVVFQSTIRDSAGAAVDVLLRVRRADASQPVRTFLDLEAQVQQIAWPASGGDAVVRLGAVDGAGPDSSADLWRLASGADSTLSPVLTGASDEFAPALSPDGRWLVFVSDESGQNEVVVRPWPNAGDGRTLVSIDGGEEPRWSPGGDEIFYRTLKGRNPEGARVMIAARVETDPDFRVTERVELFDWRFLTSTTHPTYDVNADASAFLMLTTIQTARILDGLPVHVIVKNFDVEVERILAGR